MQISLRSHLIAGAAAVVGAGAIMAPVAQGHLALPALAMPHAAQVALAAFDSPFAALLGTAEMGQNYFLGVYYNGGDAPTPGAGEANWPYAGFDQTGGDYLNYALYNNVELGYYAFVGQVPQNILDASPVIRQLETNVASYLNAGISGLIGTGLALTDGLWNFPSALVTAAQLALAGNFTEALSTLTAAVITPIQNAAASLVSAGTYIASNIAARLGAVVAALPQIVTTFVGAAAGSAALVAEEVTAVSSAVITNLLALNFQGAWNAGVAGWLGPSGLPGLSLNLLAGAGIQTGPITSAADIPTNFVPSLRTATQGAVWTLANALTASAAPAAAVPAAAAPAAARAPRSAAVSRAAATAKPAAAKASKAPRAARAVKAAH
ncbi:MAG TPA: hypothetical protein PLH92_08490 [Mycobacterium sp.]|uniref:hypothetical protein n=1 Tax=Mycolicibacterium sp. TaxID=2320850 RepID=UPI0025EC2F52|nr:hypothetical protein [Mycolicibacterium sp.]HPX36771.1 hypothetical protein [Mycobacterium sp.]HQC76745.1 hypothetical protein [Mycobacterium sp.]